MVTMGVGQVPLMKKRTLSIAPVMSQAAPGGITVKP